MKEQEFFLQVLVLLTDYTVLSNNLEDTKVYYFNYNYYTMEEFSLTYIHYFYDILQYSFFDIFNPKSFIYYNCSFASYLFQENMAMGTKQDNNLIITIIYNWQNTFEVLFNN